MALWPLLLLLLGARAALAEDPANDTAAEGWSLERMLSAYGAPPRRSAAQWGVLQLSPAPGAAPAPAGSDAWVGGVSQYYGAGGAAPIASAAGVLTPRFNALVPGFAARGAGGRRSLRANATSDDGTALRARHALLNRVETTLWAAATLRDNMVTVLGYVLNLPGDPLGAELYTALHHVYEEVRFRRFPVVALVRRLRDICRASPASQFKQLFRGMEAAAAPALTKGAARVWLEALDEEEIDVDGMLRPGGGPLVVDFLEGIDPSVVRQLADAPEFPPETEHAADAATERAVGAVVANTFAAITDGTLPLTQTLFALLLQLRPADSAVPQRLEAERFVADCLRQQRVGGAAWRKIVRRAESSRDRASDHYLRAVLWAIAESPDVEESLRDAARLVHAYVRTPVATYSNPNYKYTSALMSRPTLDVLYVLKAITPSEYPDDVVDAKNRLKFYIENGYLDMEFVVKGFNRFDHVKPINLVIAVLTRIELRLPMLSHEIKSSVKYLKVYLIFKKFLCSMSPQIPRDFLEAPFLLDAFEGPTMPKHIRSLVVRLELILRKERLPVDKLVDAIPVEECTRPRQCILNFYRRVIKGAYISGPGKSLMVSLITRLDINGDPLAPPQQPEYQIKKQRRKKCGNKLWPQIVSQPLQTTPKQHMTPKSVATSKIVISSTTSTSTTTRSTTTSKLTTTTKPTTTSAPTTMFITTTSKQTTSKEIVPFSSTTSPFPTTTVVTTTPSFVLLEHEETVEEETIYPGAPEPLVKFPTLNETEFNQKPNYSCPEELLPSTEIGTTEDTIIRPIREFIRVPNLYSWLGYSFRPETYSSKLHLLTAILKRALLSSIVRFNTVLYSSMKQYLTYLHTLPRRPQAIQYMVFPNMTEEYEQQPANYEEPYKNLPTCTPGQLECEKLHPIRAFLADENIYYKLGPYFKPSLYQTKGSFLKAVLQKALRLKYVHQNILLYRVTKQFLLHLNEMHIRPVEVKSTPFPKPDLVKEWEPPNWKRPLTLLPRTVPGTAEHIKMRPLRDFFARPDFWETMGVEFQPQKYRTKGELLIAIITHALTRQHVKDNVLLFAALNEYLSILKKSHVTTASGAPPLPINMHSLVKALPYPETTQEEQYLRHIQELFRNKQFNAALNPVVAQAKLRTRGAALQLLLHKALEMQKQYQAQGPALQALQYFKNRVIHDGYGAQAVDYLVPQKMEISVLDLFRAIDHDRLREEDRERVKRVIDFISYNFNPNKYLSGFQFEQYGTKGDFLKAAFEHMCKLKFVRPQIKDDMMFLTNYVTHQGPGAEPLAIRAENIG